MVSYIRKCKGKIFNFGCWWYSTKLYSTPAKYGLKCCRKTPNYRGDGVDRMFGIFFFKAYQRVGNKDKIPHTLPINHGKNSI